MHTVYLLQTYICLSVLHIIIYYFSRAVCVVFILNTFEKCIPLGPAQYVYLLSRTATEPEILILCIILICNGTRMVLTESMKCEM